MIVCGALLMASCQQGNRFTVEGVIEGAAEGEMLYLESEHVAGVQVLDSLKLLDGGVFEMKASRPETPDFYRLRIGQDIVHFCVDSTEVQKITGQRKGLSGNYQISGNVNSVKMKEIVTKQRAVQQLIVTLTAQARKGEMGQAEARDSLTAEIARYKEDMRLNYIFADPDKMYAYYALFQQVDGLFLFNVNDKRDISLFQAVGTCMDTFWPDAVRTKNLHNIVMKGLQEIRIAAAQRSQQLPKEKITESGVIEINLPDGKGGKRTLTSLKGKVVLLDFLLFSDKGAVKHNFFLRDLYNKYKDRGLEIYQVAEDGDHHFWRTASEALPWICVRENDEVPAAVAYTYNVTELPTMFLISRDNVLISRHTTAAGVEEALKKLL